MKKIVELFDVGVIIACILALGVGWVYGNNHGKATVQSQWDKEKYQIAQAQQETLAQGINNSYKIGLQYEEKESEIVFNTETIIKEIPVYVRDSPTCPSLPDGWSLLHDKAAASPH